MWKCFSFMTMCLRFHHVCASALLMLWSSPHAPATREKSKTSAEVHNGCAGSLAHLFAKSILFLEQMCQGASTRSKTIHLDPVRSIPQRHWAPRAPPPLSGVLAFSHPLREQHASRSWDWHLTCSCRANGIHQAHHADGFQRMPEGASTGLTLIRGNQLAIFASTLLIGLLFKPLHDRMKALIDRRFYRRKYDAARTLATFSATVRDEVDLNQLCTKLGAVVEETMQPTHVSVWLFPPKRSSEKTTRALPFIETGGNP